VAHGPGRIRPPANLDLDVAFSGPRTVEELTNALTSVSVENQHLTRLTGDLLVLSRARAGVLS
jgi:hypothetical protein